MHVGEHRDVEGPKGPERSAEITADQSPISRLLSQVRVTEGESGYKKLEKVCDALNTQSVAAITNAFRTVVADPQAELSESDFEQDFLPVTDVKVIQKMEDLERLLLPKTVVENDGQGNAIRQLKPVETLVVLVDCSKIPLQSLSRLNQNDFLQAQLKNQPVNNERVGAKYLQIVPIRFQDQRRGVGKRSDIFRRQSILVKDLVAKLDDRLESFVNSVTQYHRDAAEVAERPVHVSRSRDYGFRSPKSAMRNTMSLGENGRYQYLESELAEKLRELPAGSDLQMRYLNVNEEDQKEIIEQIQTLNEQRYMSQNCWNKSAADSRSLRLPPGVKILPPIFEKSMESPARLSVRTGGESGCDCRLNSGNVDAHIRSTGVLRESENEAKPVVVKQMLGRRIYIESNLRPLQWERLWHDMDKNTDREIVLAPEIQVSDLPSFVRELIVKAETAETEDVQASGENVRYVSRDVHEWELLLSGKDGGDYGEIRAYSVVSPETDFDEMISEVEQMKKQDRGLYAYYRERGWVEMLRQGEPVVWELAGINKEVEARLATLKADPPYLLVRGERVDATSLVLRVIVDKDLYMPSDFREEQAHVSTSVWTKATQTLLLGEQLTEAQLPLEQCEKIFKTINACLKIIDKPLTLAILRQITEQIRSRLSFETTHYYSGHNLGLMPARLIYTALKQSQLRAFKENSKLYNNLDNALKHAVKETFDCEVGIDLKPLDLSKKSHNKFHQLRKAVEAFLFEEEGVYKNESDWLGMRDYLLARKLRQPVQAERDSESARACYERFSSGSPIDEVIRHESAREKKKTTQFAETVYHQKITVLEGAPAAGKSRLSKLAAESVSRRLGGTCRAYILQATAGDEESDILTNKQVLKWIETGGVLVVDEANISSRAMLVFKELLESTEPAIQIGRKRMALNRHRLIFTGNPTGFDGRADVIGMKKQIRSSSQFMHSILDKQVTELFKETLEPRVRKQILKDTCYLYKKFLSCKNLHSEGIIPDIRHMSSILLRAYKYYVAVIADSVPTEDPIDKVLLMKRCSWRAVEELLKDTVNLRPLESIFHPNEQEFPYDFRSQFDEDFNDFMLTARQDPDSPIYVCGSDRTYVRELWQLIDNRRFARKHGINIPYQKGLIATGRAGRGKDVILAAFLRYMGVPYFEVDDVDLSNFEGILSQVREHATAGEIILIPEINRLPTEAIESLNDILTEASVIATRNPSDFAGRFESSYAFTSRVVSHHLPNRNKVEKEQLLIQVLTQARRLDRTAISQRIAAPLAKQLLFLHERLDRLLNVRLGESLLTVQLLIDTAIQVADGDSVMDAFKEQYYFYLLKTEERDRLCDRWEQDLQSMSEVSSSADSETSISIGTPSDDAVQSIGESPEDLSSVESSSGTTGTSNTKVYRSIEEVADMFDAVQSKIDAINWAFSNKCKDLLQNEAGIIQELKSGNQERIQKICRVFAAIRVLRGALSGPITAALREASSYIESSSFAKGVMHFVSTISEKPEEAPGHLMSIKFLFDASTELKRRLCREFILRFQVDYLESVFDRQLEPQKILSGRRFQGYINDPDVTLAVARLIKEEDPLSPSVHAYYWSLAALHDQCSPPIESESVKRICDLLAIRIKPNGIETSRKESLYIKETVQRSRTLLEKLGRFTAEVCWRKIGSHLYSSPDWKSEFDQISKEERWPEIGAVRANKLKHAKNPNLEKVEIYNAGELNYVQTLYFGKDIEHLFVEEKRCDCFGDTKVKKVPSDYPRSEIHSYDPIEEDPVSSDEIELTGVVPITLSKSDGYVFLPTIGGERILESINGFKDLELVKIDGRFAVKLNAPYSGESVKTTLKFRVAVPRIHMADSSVDLINTVLTAAKKESFSVEEAVPDGTSTLNGAQIEAAELAELKEYLSHAATKGEAILSLMAFFKRNKALSKSVKKTQFCGWDDLPCRIRTQGFYNTAKALGLLNEGEVSVSDSAMHSFIRIQIPGYPLLKIDLGGGYAGSAEPTIETVIPGEAVESKKSILTLLFKERALALLEKKGEPLEENEIIQNYLAGTYNELYGTKSIRYQLQPLMQRMLDDCKGAQRVPYTEATLLSLLDTIKRLRREHAQSGAFKLLAKLFKQMSPAQELFEREEFIRYAEEYLLRNIKRLKASWKKQMLTQNDIMSSYFKQCKEIRSAKLKKRLRAIYPGLHKALTQLDRHQKDEEYPVEWCRPVVGPGWVFKGLGMPDIDRQLEGRAPFKRKSAAKTPKIFLFSDTTRPEGFRYREKMNFSITKKFDVPQYNLAKVAQDTHPCEANILRCSYPDQVMTSVGFFESLDKGLVEDVDTGYSLLHELCSTEGCLDFDYRQESAPAVFSEAFQGVVKDMMPFIKKVIDIHLRRGHYGKALDREMEVIQGQIDGLKEKMSKEAYLADTLNLFYLASNSPEFLWKLLCDPVIKAIPPELILRSDHAKLHILNGYKEVASLSHTADGLDRYLKVPVFDIFYESFKPEVLMRMSEPERQQIAREWEGYLHSHCDETPLYTLLKSSRGGLERPLNVRWEKMYPGELYKLFPSMPRLFDTRL